VIIALDISTKTGFAVLEDDTSIVETGLIRLSKKIDEFGPYPDSFILAAEQIADKISKLVSKYKPKSIVIEETNRGRARYSQKILEFLHFCVISRLMFLNFRPKYISSSEWRKTLEIRLSKDDKKNNLKVNDAKRKKIPKKNLGLTGKINKKHLSVRYANDYWGINLRMKDNDTAEAMLLGLAFLRGAKVCDGK
jgi:hypothetical protein